MPAGSSAGGIEPPAEYRGAAAVAAANAARRRRALRAPSGRVGRPQGAHTEHKRRRWDGMTEPERLFYGVCMEYIGGV